MRRYESKLISQGKLNAGVYDQYLKQLMLYSSRIFWYVKSHGYETKFYFPRQINQGKGILYTHPACFGMRRYASKIFTQGNLNSFGMRRYETKFISQGKSI